MKFTCDRALLVDKLAIVGRGISTRTALPVLSGILLRAQGGTLDLYATDMELSIRANLTIEADRDGEIVVPARLFSDIVRSLPAPKLTVEASESVVKVSSGRAEFSLNSWSGSDFPPTSVLDVVGGVRVKTQPFTETLNKVGRAASKDETRPILTGVLLTIVDDGLKMVATDSYRLAVKETHLDAAVDESVEAIIPARALNEVARFGASLAAAETEIEIGDSQAVFKLSAEVGDVWVASRLIDGQFPNYKQLIPESFDHEVMLDREQITAALRRVSLLAQKNAPLRMIFAENSLTLRALTQDVGQAEEKVDIEFDGDEFEIGFSPHYLLDGIDALADAAVRLRFTSPLRPGLISGTDDGFLYLIMPIRLSS